MDAVSLHQVAYRLHERGVPFVPRAIDYLIFLLFNSVISHRCRIGSGTSCAYRGMSVLIHERAVIGERVSIGSHCVIGGRSGQEPPTIGNDVHIGANATIIGGVTVGDGAIIGAGSVVISDVPAGRVAVGNPARLLAEGHVSIP